MKLNRKKLENKNKIVFLLNGKFFSKKQIKMKTNLNKELRIFLFLLLGIPDICKKKTNKRKFIYLTTQ